MTLGRPDDIQSVRVHLDRVLRSVVKNKYKLHVAPPGEYPTSYAYFFDLYRDPREDRPKQTLANRPSDVRIGSKLAFRYAFDIPELTSRTDALVSGNLTVSILVATNSPAVTWSGHTALRQTEIGQMRTFIFPR
jgi:hypothetical protein